MIYRELKFVDNSNIKRSYQRIADEKSGGRRSYKGFMGKNNPQRKDDFELEM